MLHCRTRSRTCKSSRYLSHHWLLFLILIGGKSLFFISVESIKWIGGHRTKNDSHDKQQKQQQKIHRQQQQERHRDMTVDDKSNRNDDEYPHISSFVEMIGKRIYRKFDTPKYRFYIYMTIGNLPDEETTVLIVSTICNALYVFSILIGFIFLPRGYMLILTALTLYIGPVIALFIVGAILLMIASFAFYPVYSVAVIWIFFFSSSHMAQVAGRHLGLDSDEDGDVDMLDLLHFVGNTRWGKWLGLLKLHSFLHDSRKDPLQEIKARLDIITERLIILLERPQNKGTSNISVSEISKKL